MLRPVLVQNHPHGFARILPASWQERLRGRPQSFDCGLPLMRCLHVSFRVNIELQLFDPYEPNNRSLSCTLASTSKTPKISVHRSSSLFDPRPAEAFLLSSTFTVTGVRRSAFQPLHVSFLLFPEPARGPILSTTAPCAPLSSFSDSLLCPPPLRPRFPVYVASNFFPKDTLGFLHPRFSARRQCRPEGQHCTRVSHPLHALTVCVTLRSCFRPGTHMGLSH